MGRRGAEPVIISLNEPLWFRAFHFHVFPNIWEPGEQANWAKAWHQECG